VNVSFNSYVRKLNQL